MPSRMPVILPKSSKKNARSKRSGAADQVSGGRLLSPHNGITFYRILSVPVPPLPGANWQKAERKNYRAISANPPPLTLILTAAVTGKIHKTAEKIVRIIFGLDIF